MLSHPPNDRQRKIGYSPLKQAEPGIIMTRSKDRPGWQVEEACKKMREEIQSLSEQVAALKEIVVRSARGIETSRGKATTA